jgi:hypothetical protein
VAFRLAYLMLARVLSWMRLFARSKSSQGRRDHGPPS